MSETTLPSIEKTVRDVGVQAVWEQWASLGGGGIPTGDRPPSSIVDPEALLLLSLTLVPAEKRLPDLIRWWAEVGSSLLSVQRTKTLLDDFPAGAEERLPSFAAWAVEAGDKRWRSYESPGAPSSTDRARKGRDEPLLQAPSSLLVRLRAGFGVGAKADVLTYLLGIGEESVPTRTVTEATAYSRATVRGALKDLSRAGFIEKRSGRPARYRAPLGPWGTLLWHEAQSSTPPRWRHWHVLFAFLAEALQWARQARGQSAYVRSTRARDIFKAHARAFEANRIRAPRPENYEASAYLDAFAETIQVLKEWIPEHL